ncbi:MAG: hypothetical protein FD127_4428 [Acidimicrobiaceae bacterium]|nr:MAG: hypothetical protein FD127_4428 [Acidimicrobiaceae bacterium]
MPRSVVEPEPVRIGGRVGAVGVEVRVTVHVRQGDPRRAVGVGWKLIRSVGEERLAVVQQELVRLGPEVPDLNDGAGNLSPSGGLLQAAADVLYIESAGTRSLASR